MGPYSQEAYDRGLDAGEGIARKVAGHGVGLWCQLRLLCGVPRSAE